MVGTERGEAPTASGVPPPENSLPEPAPTVEITSPPHDHEKLIADLTQQATEVSRLKLAIAQLGRRVLERDQEVERLEAAIEEAQRRSQGLAEELSRLRGEQDEVSRSLPVVIYDTDRNEIAGVSLFTTGKGEALERLLENLLEGWRKEGRDLAVSGLPPALGLRLQGDPDGRGFDLLPSSVLFLRISRKERAALGNLPPLVVAPPEEGPPPDRT